MSYFDMNLELTEEDQMIRDSVRKFASEVIRPTARELDQMSADETVAPESPIWGFMKQAWKLGYHKAGFPEAVGGLGLTPLQMHLLMEELQCASFGLGSVLLLAGWPYAKLIHSGRQDLIEKYVVPFCHCDDASMTGCWAIMEPDRGSDQVGQGEPYYTDPKITCEVRARMDGDKCVINGQKAAWVSCGPIATHAMLNVQIDTSKGLAGGGVCFLPLNLPGVSRGKPLVKSGQRDMPQGELYFDDVCIPKSDMFVGSEEYPEWVLNNLGFGNTGVSVAAVAIARAAFEEAFSYAKERIQGGKPLIEHYAMKIRIHRMFGKVEAIRAFSRALHMMHSSIYPTLPEYAYAGKVFCTETAREVVDEAVQIHGACGVSGEYHIEKLFRDARPLTILDGENDVLSRAGGNLLKETFPRTSVNRIP
jgi:alkylation response protein AidB-like acyl-CoA dehydrogenase